MLLLSIFKTEKKHDPGIDFVPYYPKNKNLKVNNNKQNMKIWESNSPQIFQTQLLLATKQL